MVVDMTTLSAANKEKSARYMFGPRPIGAVVPGVCRTVFRKRSPAGAQLMADWPIIVGPSLAAATFPQRLAAGTLTLACAGPIALELHYHATTLMDRINQYLGRSAVTRLRFVQGAVPPPLSQLSQKPRRPPIQIDDFANGALRDALSLLGAAIKNDPA